MQKCEIRNNPGMSQYFGGAYIRYGRYQWNMKYYGWENDSEIRAAHWAFFGDDYSEEAGQTDSLSVIIGRDITKHWNFDGRSGGWLTINCELTDEELEKVDNYVKRIMDGELSKFLKEERGIKEKERLNSKNKQKENENWIRNSAEIQEILDKLELVAGSNFSLLIKGINVVKLQKGE